MHPEDAAFSPVRMRAAPTEGQESFLLRVESEFQEKALGRFIDEGYIIEENYLFWNK